MPVNSEGKILKAWLERNKMNAPDLAIRMGISKQSVYHQLEKEIISDSFKRKLTVAKVNVFDLSTPNSNILSEDVVFYNKKSNAVDYAATDNRVMLVPLVSKYAYAGYLRGYGDPEYIDSLEKIPFPVEREHKGNYKAFEVAGDSMDVDARKYYKAGDIVLGREIPQVHWKSKLHIHKWSFVIVHKTEGILIKDIVKHDVERGIITLHSLNTFYDDFDVRLEDVAQIYNVIKVIREE